MRKFIAIFLILILSLSMLTACGSNLNDPADGSNTEAVTPVEDETEVTIPEGEPLHPEDTTFPSEDDDEHEIVEFPSEDDNSILGTVRLFYPKGIFNFTVNNNSAYKIDDEFNISEVSTTQKGDDFIVYEGAKAEDGNIYTLQLSDTFKTNDMLSINVSEIQDYEMSMSVNTNQGQIGVSNTFTTRYDIRIQDEYVKFKDCFTEFAYESILCDEDNRSYNCIQIYGQLEELGDLEIYFDGIKYIAKSNQYIHGLRIAVFKNANDTDGTLTVSEVYGREFEIVIEEDGSAIFNRVVF